jgi:hypothetical protein
LGIALPDRYEAHPESDTPAQADTSDGTRDTQSIASEE